MTSSEDVSIVRIDPVKYNKDVVVGRRNVPVGYNIDCAYLFCDCIVGQQWTCLVRKRTTET